MLSRFLRLLRRRMSGRPPCPTSLSSGRSWIVSSGCPVVGGSDGRGEPSGSPSASMSVLSGLAARGGSGDAARIGRSAGEPGTEPASEGGSAMLCSRRR